MRRVCPQKVLRGIWKFIARPNILVSPPASSCVRMSSNGRIVCIRTMKKRTVVEIIIAKQDERQDIHIRSRNKKST